MSAELRAGIADEVRRIRAFASSPHVESRKDVSVWADRLEALLAATREAREDAA